MTGESGGYPLCMIDMKDLWRSYRKQPALSGFSGEIELERGLIYGLIGPNGSGKTTLLKLLAGILFPSGGRIFRKGEGRKKQNCAEQEASFPAWSRENVVYIPAGERGLRYKNTVRDNVLYFSALKGRSAEETEALLTRYASFLHCETLLDRRVETLSLGQKKKASLLCGLCAGARLILMDEPEGGLDLDARGELRRTILQTARREGVTFLISSHDLLLFEGLADRYLFLRNGKDVFHNDGTMDRESLQAAYERLTEEGRMEQ